MREKLNIQAIASVINEENCTIYSHEANIGTGNIFIEYNYINRSRDNALIEGNYLAGAIEVYSDGFVSCDIFDEEFAPIIVKDYLTISGEHETPTEMFWHTRTNDKERWKKVKSFIQENGIELKYSEDIAFERDLKKGLAYLSPEEEDRLRHIKKHSIKMTTRN